MAKTPKWKKDPHAAREAEKYANPVPSREYIMSLLETHGCPMSEEELLDAMDISLEDEEGVSRRLRAMIRDGQLIRTRKGTFGLVSKMDLVRGRIKALKDGWGELVTGIEGDDQPTIVLHPRTMRAVWPGDVVLVALVGKTRRGEEEGKIVDVLERRNTEIVGRLFTQDNVFWVEPEDKNLQEDIIIPGDATAGATQGQYVVAVIVKYPTQRALATGKVVEVLGEHMAPGMEIDVAIRSKNIPHVWPEGVEDACKDFGHDIPETAKQGRADLQAMPFVTIDGEDAKDFDDAVYCQPREKGGFRLFVAIADVSFYVTPGSALDEEAKLRGNSIYFPGHVVPMLPEVLSNHLCSLKPKTPRLALVCEMTIASDGKLSRYRFYRAVIRSHARLTYNQVSKFLGDKPHGIADELHSHIKVLHQVFLCLHAARRARGAIEFETTETQIIFDKARKIKKILPRVRNEAHCVIEECMLVANLATARYLNKANLPILYRNHDTPKADRLGDLRLYLRTLGIGLSGGDKPKPKDYENVMLQIQGRPDANLIQMLLLRSMSQAHYHPDNIGHFGLAYEEYTHFTSPIRRYPDMLVHRAIVHACHKELSLPYPYDHDGLLALGEQCSMTERRSDSVTWDVIAWLKCEFMLDKVGEIYDGVINSVTHFGIFVELSKIYVEGLVHISDLTQDYYHHDPATMSLTGERSGQVFKVGRKVQVQVARVNLDERHIDFVIHDEKDKQDKKDKKAKKGKKDKQDKKDKKGKKDRKKS